MELLELLESRVDSLVTEIEFLRKENVKLRDEASAGLAALTEENNFLKRTLEEERQVKEAVLQRVDGLLLRLQGVASSGTG
jgi:cell division protein ZapB